MELRLNHVIGIVTGRKMIEQKIYSDNYGINIPIESRLNMLWNDNRARESKRHLKILKLNEDKLIEQNQG